MLQIDGGVFSRWLSSCDRSVGSAGAVDYLRTIDKLRQMTQKTSAIVCGMKNGKAISVGDRCV